MATYGRMFVDCTAERRRPEEIIEAVAESHGLTVDHLVSKRRDRQIVRARHQAMHELHQELGLSTPVIGRLLGNRDHTSVLYGLKAFKSADPPPRRLSSQAVAERLRCIDLVLSTPAPRELRPHLEALAERMRR